MVETTRLVSEREFHDRQAAGRAKHFAAVRAELIFDDDDYLDHETWVRPAMSKLGPLAGKVALDFGCGHGMAATVLARGGATVHAFDLSPGYVSEAKDRAESNGVHVDFQIANGEALPYADESFDAVWGCAILHHLDLTIAGPEICRVLKPGGAAVFCEPWDGNRLLAFARNRLPYPGKHRTPDEQPLTKAMVEQLRASVPNATIEMDSQQFVGMVGRILPWRWLKRGLAKIDTVLFRWLPFLQGQCRYMVLTIRKS